MKDFLIGTITITHCITSFVIYTFWLLLPKKYLKYYAISLLLLIAHWYICDNKCILTIIEYKLKNKDVSTIYYDSTPFIKDMCSKLGITIDEKKVVYLMTIMVYAITLFTICRINIEK
jgi:hypothetical protein